MKPLFGCSAVLLTSASLRAASLYWDANPAAPEQQNGSGEWNVYLNKNWFNAGDYTNNYWTNSGDDSAVFGGGSGNAGTVWLDETRPGYYFVPMRMQDLFFLPAAGGPFIVQGSAIQMPARQAPHYIQVSHDTIITSMTDFRSDVLRIGTSTLTLNNQQAESAGVASENWLAHGSFRCREGTTVINGKNRLISYNVSQNVFVGDSPGKPADLICEGGYLYAGGVYVGSGNGTSGTRSSLTVRNQGIVNTDYLSLGPNPLYEAQAVQPLVKIAGAGALQTRTTLLAQGPGTRTTVDMSEGGVFQATQSCLIDMVDDGSNSVDIDMQKYALFQTGEIGVHGGRARISMADTSNLLCYNHFYTYDTNFRLDMGGDSSLQTGALSLGGGVVVMRGGSVSRNSTPIFNPSCHRIGYLGYGYWHQSGGANGYNGPYAGEIEVGYSGTGCFRQTGGKTWVSGGSIGMLGSGDLLVDGGTFDQLTETGEFDIGLGGDGTFTVVSPATASFAGNLRIGSSAPNPYPGDNPYLTGGAGTVNVKDTLLAVHNVTGISGTGRLNLEGATIQDANGMPASISGAGRIVLRGTGVTFDIRNSCYVGQSISQASGYGLTGIPLLTAGTDYIGPPVVAISGGAAAEPRRALSTIPTRAWSRDF